MLFNSYAFIFGFLPIALAGFYLAGMRSRDAALAWLIAASLFFYAWWRPLNVALISPSILINFGLARLLLRWSEARPAAARAVLLGGIAFNVCFLGYFKYANFVLSTAHDVFGTNYVLTRVILPLGISFITFQKIAFLIDVQAGRVRAFGLRDYALFVLFFPQLIAGPIVHYREMMPQFQAARCRFDAENAAVGLTLFCFGLFKKLLLADSIAPLIAPAYAAAGAGQGVTLIPAWVAAIGFTLQIYFDFSGYTDMALGLARLFGVKLPMNFDSPLRATSIIEFWLRWHITLTRFLTAYIYNPLVLSLTRRRAARGKSLGRRMTLEAFVFLLAFPTLLTMFVSGLWHGAGYTFVVWGLLHGVYLTINHAWRLLRPRVWPNDAQYARLMPPAGFALTFLAVVAGMVVFRAPTLAAAGRVLRGMAGGYGTSLPRALYDRLGAGWLHGLGVVQDYGSGRAVLLSLLWTALLLAIALVAPNTLRLMAAYEPALGVKPRRGARGLVWRPTAGWAVGVSLAGAIGIMALGQLSEFLYWQF